MSKYVFYLGGKDAEMMRIKELLSLLGHEYHDKGLTYSAHSQDYAREIETTISLGKTIVLVEVCNLFRAMSKDSKEKTKIQLPKGSVLISHKMDFNREYESLIQPDSNLLKRCRYDVEKSSLIQVLKLIKVKPTRFDLLIAANDTGSVGALIQMKATPSEISEVRNKQRRALGISLEEEIEAEEAILSLKNSNTLTVVRVNKIRLNTIAGCSTITDRLCTASGGAGYKNLLILSENSNEVMYFGSGDVCCRINKEFINQRSVYAQIFGGKGYWGGYPNQNDLITCISNILAEERCE